MKYYFYIECNRWKAMKIPCQLSHFLNPLPPNSDLSQLSHCNINSHGLLVNEVTRIENMITLVKFS